MGNFLIPIHNTISHTFSQMNLQFTLLYELIKHVFVERLIVIVMSTDVMQLAKSLSFQLKNSITALTNVITI